MDRLQKVIAQHGVCSRRKAEELILAGRVSVNGSIVKELPVMVGKKDVITVDNVPLGEQDKEYFVLHKPKQVLSSVTDDRGRRCAVDFIQSTSRIYPVGRLDYDTSGVLLLSSDGDFTNHLTHPSHEIEKEYVANLKGRFTLAHQKQVAKGMTIDDDTIKGVKVVILETNKEKNTSKVQLVLTEGKNRQIKRMMAELGLTVTSLKRTRVGVVDLRGLKLGEYRRLRIHEIKHLMK